MSPEQQNLFDVKPGYMGPTYVPAQRHSPTSVAAAEKIRPKLQVRERMVLGLYIQAGPVGLTDNEAIAKNAVHPNGVRARRVALVEKGFLRHQGERDGSKIHVWTGKKEEEL